MCRGDVVFPKRPKVKKNEVWNFLFLVLLVKVQSFITLKQSIKKAMIQFFQNHVAVIAEIVFDRSHSKEF